MHLRTTRNEERPKINRAVSAPGRPLPGAASPFGRPGAAAIAGVKVRRFEMGASGEGWDRFLVDRGYVIAASGGTHRMYKIRGPNGKNLKSPRGTAWHSTRELMALLDLERKKAGLMPIRLENVP